MYSEELALVAGAAQTKSGLLRNNPAGYFILSVMAGMFIGFGILISFTAGGLLQDFAGAKLVMGASFGVARSLLP